MYVKFFKRFFDFIFSLIAVVVLSPVLLALIIVGAVAMRGNPFFVQPRPGKKGKDGQEKIFKLVKFRTMDNRKDKDGNLLPDDVRLNKYGKIMRITSLDELPELINILKGDMTFIGPRPDTPVGSAAYTEEEKVILTVKPGVTGYNQAVNRNSVLTKEKLRNDIYYVNHLSVLFDIKIIFMTVATVLGHKNVNRKNEDTSEMYVINEDGKKVENTMEIK